MNRKIELEKDFTIIQDFLCRKCVPYKNRFDCLKPCECIASFYTPTAAQLKIHQLNRKKCKINEKVLPFNAFGPDGELTFPPIEFVRAIKQTIDIKNAEKIKLLESQSSNIINLYELTSGTFYDRKNHKRKLAIDREHKKKLKQLENELNEQLLEKEILSKNEADLPRTIESQRDELLKSIGIDESIELTDENTSQINYLIDCCLTDDFIEPYDVSNFRRVKKNLSQSFRKLKKYESLMKSLESEVIKDYQKSIKSAIVFYILQDDYERKRLLVSKIPVKYPICIIRSPVPWHQTFISSSNYNYHNLFIGNEILRDIKDLWFSKYSFCKIVKMKDLGKIPVPALKLESMVKNLCHQSSEILVKEWLADVAELFLKKKYAWSCLFKKTPNSSILLIEKYFRSVNSLLSKQLRILVIETLIEVKDFFIQYKSGNTFEKEYQDLLFNQTSLMTIEVEPVIGSSKLNLVPNLTKIYQIISNCFDEILAVGSVIPKIESILFPEFEEPIYLSSVSRNELQASTIINEALEVVKVNEIGPNLYLKRYESLMYILDGRVSEELDKYFETQSAKDLKVFGKRIDDYDNLNKKICLFRNKIPLNLIELDCINVNNTIRNILDSLRTRICDYFLKELRENNSELCDIFSEISDKIGAMPETTQQVVDLLNFLCKSRDHTMFNLKSKLKRCSDLILFLFNYQPLDCKDIQLNSRTLNWPKQMEIEMELATANLNTRKEFVEGVLRNRRENFEQKILEMQTSIDLFKKRDPPVLTVEEMEQATKKIEELSKRMEEMRQESEQINEEEVLLDIEVTSYLNLLTMSSTVDTFDKLWHTVLNFHRKYEKWYYGPFTGLDANEIRDETDNAWQILYKLGRALSDTPGARRIAEMIRGKVEKFKQFLPVLETICNPGLRSRHWEQISKIVNVTIIPNENSSLSEMIEYGFLNYINKLEEISSAAMKEHTLEMNLMKMQIEWQNVYFNLIPYRESGVEILSAVDDIQMLLDDHILKAQTMRGSQFVKAFEIEMENWENKLISMQDIIDQWLICQATWMYLEPIFGSEDIMRQMPGEAENFRKVDKIWRSIMITVAKNKKVIEATSIPDMLDHFKLCNSLLEKIQKSLNDYLEKKRLFFPRFFFLSNDELLEILSETKDPQQVQPHLKKCFEGINRLYFIKNEEIIGIISAEEEYVPFTGKIYPSDAKGMVEKWLVQIEEMMFLTLRDIAQDCIIAYFEINREEWVLSWPGQIILCSSQIHWTSDVCDSFTDGSIEKYLIKLNDQIEKMMILIRKKLDRKIRITLNALITIDIHARDVVKLLIKYQVKDPTDFNWISQLRYYWLDGGINVSMITTDVNYGYEYLGNTSRLVITPLTDRCYRTLMGALKLNHGGAPEGPTATGKTETCKDLAKAIAKQCIVFNCSKGLDYKAMGKFFKGLAQSGVWICFDEFNKIKPEVLSVIAQQILTIQMAIETKTEHFIFEGIELKMNPTCNIFITMNPGYTCHQQQLPDNLKVLFRSVAMTRPDYKMIGEVTLFSYGFVDAKNLAIKIVHTYKLFSEQLNTQSHYDYGMRAFKTVLLSAGELKLEYPDEDESALILRAINNVNISKLTAQDILLLDGIYTDIFPDVKLLKTNRQDLIECIKVHLNKRNLQATPWYINKIIQIYEMILIRHGLMIVGDTLGGKTQGFQILADALGDLSVMNEFKTIYRIINPKAVSIDFLYGSFDAVTHEWSDGVLSNTFRDFTQSLTTDRKWIVFDGPVHDFWIESMNTLLDDSKKLCLISGEIINMSNKMNIIFETNNLDQASPATVSRCGIIYMESSQLGWQSIFYAYKNKLIEKMPVEQFNTIVEIIEWITDPIFSFIKNNCQKFIDSSDMNMFLSFMRIFNIMLENENQMSIVWLQCTLLFSIVWGFASTLGSNSRKKFDTYFRDLLIGNNEQFPKSKAFKLSKQQIFPDRGTVFDWIYDKKNNGTWIPWIETSSLISSPVNDTKANEMIIQTNQVALQHFFINKFIGTSIPILFIGPTGTGKSTIILDYLDNLPKEKFIDNVINFSAFTSANQTQEIVMSKLDRRRKGVYGPTMGKKCLLFIDNLSMPMEDSFGSQPTIELLRQWIDHGYWFDMKDTKTLYLVDILILAAMQPTEDSNLITPRLIRHMNIIGIDSFDDATITKIFSSILDCHFAKGFDNSILKSSRMIIAATIDIFHSVVKHFLPIPAKNHYIFNLRDFSHVINGIVLVPATRMKDSNKLIKLWIHEIYRVFHDRLVDNNDQYLFFKMVKQTVRDKLKQPIDKVLENLLNENEKIISEQHILNLFFGIYMEPDADPKIYDEVVDLNELKEKMEYYLKEYNLQSKTPLPLVFFQYMINHISRISRVLITNNKNSGHLLLVGVDGFGRTSCTKLATKICEYEFEQIEIICNYSLNKWREDLKKLLLKIGSNGKSTVFLLSDNQLKDDAFIEDINMILNSGDIPNLFNSEEKSDILEKMTDLVRSNSEKKLETTPMALYNMFTERIKKNLHIVIALSPIGNGFRHKIKMFPSLVNYFTIDWFMPWPGEALEKIASVSLENLDINQEIREKCITICKKFHESVEKTSLDYEKIQKRTNYVTPINFLQLIKSFNKLYNEKVKEITSQQMRYEIGLEKLDFAAGQVLIMQKKLHVLQPKLIAQSQLSDKLMIKIEQDTVNVEAKKEVVAADEALANEAAAAAQAIKDDCESDLAEATPALESALIALNTLKPADITIVKSMKSPPAGVRLVMEAVCVLKGIKPERVQDSSGQLIDDFWPACIKILGDMKFLESLKTFDKDNIPSQNMKRIREKYMNDRNFQPDVIKKVSTACEGLCKWVRAMEVYDRVIKVVAPKKLMLAEAEAALASQMETLNAKRALLQEVTDKLQTLNDEFAECMREKKKLEDQIDHCIQKLDRAGKLLGGLGGEKSRWGDTATKLGTSLHNIIGDVLLASGIIAYFGAFTVEYRMDLITNWHNLCLSIDIPCSENFKLQYILGDSVEIHNWLIQSLPADNFTIENGIIIKYTNQWPLMIDPQSQANEWIKKMEKQNNLNVIKLTDPNYIQIIKDCIELGIPLLLENILQDLDDIFEPILLKNIYKENDISLINFGNTILNYNDNFRFYITTKLRNPHYLPNITVKVTLINFIITPEGLQDQLLSIVVAKDLPILEEKKNQLIIEDSNNKKILKEIEDKILQILSTSEGNILEDETAIKILSSSKLLSEEIQIKQNISMKTSMEIDKARNAYKIVSHHGAILFFCILDLVNINPMYQYSLSWFINLYIFAIMNSEKSDNLNQRLDNLNQIFTQIIYKNICQSLFEKDKLVFSLILTMGILHADKKIDEDKWRFFLTSQINCQNVDTYPNINSTWITKKMWSQLIQASELYGLEKLKTSLKDNILKWQVYYNLPNPQEHKFPSPFDDIADNQLDRLIILKCIRPDKLISAVEIFISKNIGQFYIEPPIFDLDLLYNDSNNITPLIFILSPGSDPVAGRIFKFAEMKGMAKEKLIKISLGQGQESYTINVINKSMKNGNWVILENCHLAECWMEQLERIFDELIKPENTNEQFRLWLISYPSKVFPVSILQNGIKITNEPSKGFKSNLLRCFTNDPLSDPLFFNNSFKSIEWRSLIFSLCFFHVIIQERRQFKSLGWNVPYEFNESDFWISLKQLQIFLNNYETVPFDALIYLTGECNYGGKVTDDWDRRLLNSLLKTYYNSEVIETLKIKLSPSCDIFIPKDISYEDCTKYIANLQVNENAEIYGLHQNADITKNNKESMELLAGVLLIQESININNEDEYSDDKVKTVIDDILEKLPADKFDIEIVFNKFPILYMNSMNSVLHQEIIRFNRLTDVIKSSLQNLKKAINGQITMSATLEQVLSAISIGKVPILWSNVSYPSLKSLASYIIDLLQRLEFFQCWIDNNPPIIYWISGFFFTQSFLTGILQNYSRINKISIYNLELDFQFINESSAIINSPSVGVYINGLFLEGARWNRDENQLDESKAKVIYDILPVIWIKPKVKNKLKKSFNYKCPVYKTSVRSGVTSLADHSSNFIFYILIPTNVQQSHWTCRGVACLTQLNE